MAVAFPSVPISQSSTRTTAIAVSVAQFGMGFEQVTPLGRNFKRDKWSIRWDACNSSETTAVLAFLDAMAGGDVTSWQSPLDAAPKKFRLDGDPQIQNVGGSIYAIGCNLRQVFEV